MEAINLLRKADFNKKSRKLWIKIIIKNFRIYIKKDEKIIHFGSTKVSRNKYQNQKITYQNQKIKIKIPVAMNNVDINKITVSKVSFG